MSAMKAQKASIALSISKEDIVTHPNPILIGNQDQDTRMVSSWEKGTVREGVARVRYDQGIRVAESPPFLVHCPGGVCP